MELYLKLKKAYKMYAYILYMPWNTLILKLNHVKIGSNLKIWGNLHIFMHYSSGKIKIGDNVTINSADWANPIGAGNRTYIQLFNNAELIIGNNCGISNAAFSCATKIVLENHVFLGSGCKLYDTDFHSLDFAERIRENCAGASIKTSPILVKEGAFIGAGSYILKGVTIGEHSIIGAGSVVTKNVADNEIWAGNPAKFIRKIDVISH